MRTKTKSIEKGDDSIKLGARTVPVYNEDQVCFVCLLHALVSCLLPCEARSHGILTMLHPSDFSGAWNVLQPTESRRRIF